VLESPRSEVCARRHGQSNIGTGNRSAALSDFAVTLSRSPKLTAGATVLLFGPLQLLSKSGYFHLLNSSRVSQLASQILRYQCFKTRAQKSPAVSRLQLQVSSLFQFSVNRGYNLTLSASCICSNSHSRDLYRADQGSISPWAHKTQSFFLLPPRWMLTWRGTQLSVSLARVHSGAILLPPKSLQIQIKFLLQLFAH
jgi:hypothetical protein